MADYNDLDTPKIAVIGFVSAVLTFVAIIALQLLYYWYDSRATDAAASNRKATAADGIIAEQEARLEQYGWIDRKQGRVAIPVDRAGQLVLRERLRRRERSRNTIPNDTAK